jgi:hypothetical protein
MVCQHGEAVSEIQTHETGETLEGTGNTDMGVDFDQYALGGVDIHLQQASFVQGRVEKSEQALNRVSLRREC